MDEAVERLKSATLSNNPVTHDRRFASSRIWLDMAPVSPNLSAFRELTKKQPATIR
jgi:hypothetical protein